MAEYEHRCGPNCDTLSMSGMRALKRVESETSGVPRGSTVGATGLAVQVVGYLRKMPRSGRVNLHFHPISLPQPQGQHQSTQRQLYGTWQREGQLLLENTSIYGAFGADPELSLMPSTTVPHLI